MKAEKETKLNINPMKTDTRPKIGRSRTVTIRRKFVPVTLNLMETSDDSRMINDDSWYHCSTQQSPKLP